MELPAKQNLPKFSPNRDEWTELSELKQRLNKEKSKLDLYTDKQQLHHMTAPMREYDLLRSEKGILVTEYGAEIVTNAWLKMYEILNKLNPFFAKIAKSRNAELKTLHLEEAPGNFLLAFNHFLKTKYKHIYWNWTANSYRDLYNKNSSYLSDDYGLMKKFKTQWIYGADCDGDITSPANIRSFAQSVIKVHVVTSDVKYVPENPNYNEEENYNIPVHLGHIITSIMCLKKGGIAILKHLTLLEPASISLLYLLTACFESVEIFKPDTSKPANSEVYLICIGFKKISDAKVEQLLEYMQMIRFMNNAKGSPALFQKNDLPLNFIQEILKINKQLTELQILNIEKMMESIEKNKDKKTKDIYLDCLSARNEKAKLWINKMQIEKLAEKDHLL